jgi:radical SAM-linked protein
MSNGFHPKIKMSLPSALALGIEGFDEVLELELNDSIGQIESSVLIADLNRSSVNGLNFLSARLLNETERKGQLESSVFEMIIPEHLCKELAIDINNFLSQKSILISKTKTPTKKVDVRHAVTNIKFQPESGLLQVEVISQEGPEAGVRELLTALNLDKEYFQTIFPKRIKCNLINESQNNSHPN